MKKPIIIFALITVLAVGMTVYGWIFVDGQIGEAVLTEDTLMGNREAAAGLTVGFRVDSADDLHWMNRFNYSTGETKSVFKRGEMSRKDEPNIYDDMRFTGWSTAPFFTRLENEMPEGLQDKKIQAFYSGIQKQVMESGSVKTGKIKVKDYLDYYPVSFRFQFGTKNYNSENALNGLKFYEEKGENTSAYDKDMELYVALNNLFKIPVIDNEYQEYKISKLADYDAKSELGYKTEIEKPLGKGEDYYEFDPVIVLQEENIKDGKTWEHADLSGGLSYDADNESDDAYIGRLASEYNLKNRMLFAVNNRTVKGTPVDVSKLGDGYGVYELPFVVVATTTISHNPKSRTVINPEPQIDKMKMVYPLDEEAEYVEMSLSGDHKFLAVFFVKEGDYFVDMVDADTWKSPGAVKLFPASENMTYTWGEDGSLAAANHNGYIAVLSRAADENSPYEILYSGKTAGGFDRAFFDTKMTAKENSTARYRCGVDRGLAVAVKDGRAALVQNLLVGDSKYNFRNAALECAVIDKTGVIYRGRLKSDIVDLDDTVSGEEIQNIKDSEMQENLIRPVRNENWVKWHQ